MYLVQLCEGELLEIKQNFGQLLRCFLLIDSGSTPYYLGGRDDVIEGTWVWASTDNIMKYTAWGPGEPNGQTGSNCLTMYHTLQWKWSDDPCKAEFFFICEKMLVILFFNILKIWNF